VSGQRHAPPRPRFTPRERTPDTHCTVGWVGPRADLDTEARGKIFLPLPGIEPRSPGRPARSQTLYCLSYQAPTLQLLTVSYFHIFSWTLCFQTSSVCGLPPNVAVEWQTLLFHVGTSRVQISSRRSAVLTEGFRGYPQLLQAHTSITSFYIISNYSTVYQQSWDLRFSTWWWDDVIFWVMSPRRFASRYQMRVCTASQLRTESPRTALLNKP
jgi:hypothetical protein